MRTAALERMVRSAGARRAEAGDHCGLCRAPVPAQHRHLYDVQAREVMCACQACALLFQQQVASNGHFRLVPQRRLRLPAFSTAALGVPVGLAFFVRHGDGVVAHYPSPAGATEWEADPDAWRQVVAARPELEQLEPELEALVVNTARGWSEHWIVPIDDCFRLVAVVRREWRGLSGGSTVWPAVAAFFAGLEDQD
jgi:hypothetical protein